VKKIPENVKALTTFKKSPYPYASSARMILRHYQTTGGARKISTHTYAASVLKKRKKKKEKNEVSFGFPLVHVAISNSPCQRMMQSWAKLFVVLGECRVPPSDLPPPPDPIRSRLIPSTIRKSCVVPLPINSASIEALIQSSSLDPAKSSVNFFLFFFS
jgi:hypothetical protein